MTVRDVNVGAVVIGRNEGQRLHRCLSTLQKTIEPVVYVDSGSTDQSVRIAKQLGAIIVHLDSSLPFTAARARNAGLEELVRRSPHVRFVQFIDGDCALESSFIPQGMAAMDESSNTAVVCGRRREMFPERSVYNRLCDIEWNTPVGSAASCGGDALIRVSAFREVGGYDGSLIAGEEPEMCLRLRRRGWLIERIDADMTKHDADMHRFGQWWRRSIRAGHAYMEGFLRHRSRGDRYRSREVWSTAWWGIALPVVSIVLAVPTLGISLLGLGTYALLWLRIYGRNLSRCGSSDAANLYAGSCVIAKFAIAWGMAGCLWHRWRGTARTIIEYRQVDQSDQTDRRKAA